MEISDGDIVGTPSATDSCCDLGRILDAVVEEPKVDLTNEPVEISFTPIKAADRYAMETRAAIVALAERVQAIEDHLTPKPVAESGELVMVHGMLVKASDAQAAKDVEANVRFRTGK